ncbi:ABC transporter permease [Psychrobacillus glaciei]|uniref:ABC transporter permease n=1 Tax=Psychrobacillus glaciei TaxID=2283160 RepID=A0A5J6SIA7_9BACI|nr:ABC-2 transporter permease [Psychrobacillus glaciei]QFF97551.1 ABC transporter permease [Psychrobacillus glaciei]
MSKQLFKHTGMLAYFILRQNRLRISIWIIALLLITLSTANAFKDLYQTSEDRQAIAQTMLNPAMTAMVGHSDGLDNYTNGAMMAHQMLLFTAIAVAIMSILLVVRHTRAEEEDGQMELIRSLPIGRLSNLSATVLVVSGTNILLAFLMGFGLYALGIESMDLEGSVLYGAALGATGIIFTGITAVFAQLSENSRGTIGLSFAVLIIAYLIRAVGDVSNETLSWFSPLGIPLKAEVYVHNNWSPILLLIGLALVLLALAIYLNSIRDLAAGFLPSRPGKMHASAFLKSPIGLALRIQRTGLIAWAIGILILGASYGSVLGDLESFFKDVEMMKILIKPVEGFSLIEQFIPILMTVLAMLCTVPVLIILFKLKSEEKKNHTEHLLSRGISRARIIGSYFVISIGSSVMMLFLAVVGLWSASATVMDDAISFATLFNAGMVYLPAMWTMISLAVLLVGFLPQFTGFAWLYLVYSFVVVYLGGLLQIPNWMSNLTPYGHIPKLPVQEMDYMSVTVLLIIAIVLATAGFILYNRRDILG